MAELRAGGEAVAVGREGIAATRVAPDADAILLGVDPATGRGVFAQRAARDAELVSLRELAASVDGAEAGLLAYAAGMVNWHGSARFCGRCGEPTEVLEAGFTRRCANGHSHHPRTDPVVIMLVVDQDRDRVLMGRQPSWPAHRFSALAGFVEPGESLEAAVAREVGEESGVQVGEVRYVASQPWPFPLSLMLGFEADFASGEAAPSDAELEAVRWFSRDEVAAAAGEDVGWESPDDDGPPRLLLPPTLAIARFLIDGWLSRSGG